MSDKPLTNEELDQLEGDAMTQGEIDALFRQAREANALRERAEDLLDTIRCSLRDSCTAECRAAAESEKGEPTP